MVQSKMAESAPSWLAILTLSWDFLLHIYSYFKMKYSVEAIYNYFILFFLVCIKFDTNKKHKFIYLIF